jgi:lipoprotein-anchoring transpeptidase ErfK/SrfK
MLEKIKSLGNVPLIVVLIVVVIIAIVLSVVKFQKADETNADTYVSNVATQENEEPQEEEQEEEIIVTEIIDQESEEETTEETLDMDAKYFIRVNYGQNVVTIYVKDTNGEYSIPYKAMVCSTGKATPRSGTYTIPSGTYSRGTWGMMIGNVWAQYFTRIKGSILFHSVPYTERNKWSLEYWEYDKLGTAASAGCIRLTVQDAKWIYNNCPAGTQVEFYTDSNPGPLGKPTAQKISEEEPVRGWDPTDPDPTNPWKTYNPSQKEEAEENNTTTTPTKPTTPVTPTKPSTSTTPDEMPEQNTGNETTTPGESDTSKGNQSSEGTTDGGKTTPDEGTNGVETTNPDEGTNGGETPNPDKGTTGEETTNPDETETPDSDVQVPNQSGNSEENKGEIEGITGEGQQSPGTTEEIKTPEEDIENNQVTDTVNV